MISLVVYTVAAGGLLGLAVCTRRNWRRGRDPDGQIMATLYLTYAVILAVLAGVAAHQVLGDLTRPAA